MNCRTCIITKQTYEKAALIRFVVAPNSEIIPDLKGNLPGRGVYILARKSILIKALQKTILINYFKTKLKKEVHITENMEALIDKLLVKSAISAIALGRKAGIIMAGALACEKAVRAKKAILVLHSKECAKNSITKIAQAIHASQQKIKQIIIFSNEEFKDAFGQDNIQHLAILDSPKAKNILVKLEKLHIYRE